MTLNQMLLSCSGRWTGRAELLNKEPVNVVVDSRQAGEGSLFLALRGERTDGHKYIPDVLKKGALAVLCEEEGGPDEPRIVVPDVMAAMRTIASFNRQRMGIPFIGVTGSVGKTTAKEMIAAALSARFRTFKTPGSMNGQIGLPATLMTLEPNYDAAVIEMGISLFGEMTRLTQVVHPDIAVFTNIGDAHLEALHDRSGILRAKSEILVGMKEDSVVIVNGDDELLSQADFGRRTVRFGLGENCQVRASHVMVQNGDSLCCRITSGDKSFDVRIPAYGKYIVYAVLAAAAVGLELGMTGEEIARGLENYQTIGHRSRMIKTPYCTIVDDCYNANPTSNRAAIDSLTDLTGRKVCILGDMREMGARSAELHREIGCYAREHNVDLILTEGKEAAFIAEGAGEIAHHFSDRLSLLQALKDWIRPGDTVLVKASHGPNFADVVEALLALQ